MDRLTPERRSWLMSRVPSRNTKPELMVRSALHRMGYRFRLHVPALPGKPDLVFPRLRKIVFVHGCYWHGHSCRYGVAQSKSNVAFWKAKIYANRSRDRRTVRQLRQLGWDVLVIWECEIKNNSWLPGACLFLGERQKSLRSS